LLCAEIKTEADSSDERDGDKSAAFTVLLHGSLKVEQMVALVQIGFVHFAVLSSAPGGIQALSERPTGFLQCFDIVSLVI